MGKEVRKKTKLNFQAQLDSSYLIILFIMVTSFLDYQALYLRIISFQIKTKGNKDENTYSERVKLLCNISTNQ